MRRPPPVRWPGLVPGLAVQKSKTLVAQTCSARKSGELHGELDDLGGLQLRNVERGVKYAKFEAAVLADVVAASVRVDLERG